MKTLRENLATTIRRDDVEYFKLMHVLADRPSGEQSPKWEREAVEDYGRERHEEARETIAKAIGTCGWVAQGDSAIAEWLQESALFGGDLCRGTSIGIILIEHSGEFSCSFKVADVPPGQDRAYLVFYNQGGGHWVPLSVAVGGAEPSPVILTTDQPLCDYLWIAAATDCGMAYATQLLPLSTDAVAANFDGDPTPYFDP